ncbi:hypothetical protein [Kribbella sp. CA-293567]|uniref:hypothetical protein n=1 Tax=Kribbella sp. CA-293567 TaxID=3002436 RepID=UPI0022DDAC19|nr:hypothetical protein [Kribbella sp. CA-293567]WBQ02945.1 hypothetical protein OX958_23530 [Kribbella sp. CA-293567]
MSKPDLDAVKTYLGADTQYEDADITAALTSEAAAQASRCRVPGDAATWPADLAEALCRRVARNLAMRGLPLGLVVNAVDDGESATTRVGADIEVRRLEAPWRRLAIG